MVISKDPRHSQRLAVGLSLPVYTTKVRHGCDLYTQRSACEANALTDCQNEWNPLRVEAELTGKNSMAGLYYAVQKLHLHPKVQVQHT